jgi:hypothetical protein
MKIASTLNIAAVAGLLCSCTISVDDGLDFVDGDASEAEEPGDDGGADGGDEGDGGGDDGDDGGDGGDGGEEGGGGGSEDVCGDGVLGASEACDGTEFSETCQTLGYEEGELTCDDTCRFDATPCFTCGNDKIEGPETCDGGLPEYASCASLGFTEGAVTCDLAACQIDTTQCTLCGDGEMEGNEECDGEQLDGHSCENMGYESGTLGCSPDTCQLDLDTCVAFEFHEDFEGGEIDSVWEFSGSAGWTLTNADPITGTYSAESGEIVDLGASSISIILEFTMDGEVSFAHRESTEAGFDALKFYVDGVEQNSWSGITQSRVDTVQVPAGTHRLMWTYLKDAQSAAGDDKVWIDDIQAIGAILPEE